MPTSSSLPNPLMSPSVPDFASPVKGPRSSVNNNSSSAANENKSNTSFFESMRHAQKSAQDKTERATTDASSKARLAADKNEKRENAEPVAKASELEPTNTESEVTLEASESSEPFDANPALYALASGFKLDAKFSKLASSGEEKAPSVEIALDEKLSDTSSDVDATQYLSPFINTPMEVDPKKHSTLDVMPDPSAGDNSGIEDSLADELAIPSILTGQSIGEPVLVQPQPSKASNLQSTTSTIKADVTVPLDGFGLTKDSDIETNDDLLGLAKLNSIGGVSGEKTAGLSGSTSGFLDNLQQVLKGKTNDLPFLAIAQEPSADSELLAPSNLSSAASASLSSSIISNAPGTTLAGVDATRVSVPVSVTFGHPQWTADMAEKTAWAVSKNIQSADIQLDPPELGPLQVKIHINNDQASVNFISANPMVREALDQTMARLKDLLLDQGMHLVDSGVSDHAGQQGNDHEQAAGGLMAGSETESSREPASEIQLSINQGIDYFA